MSQKKASIIIRTKNEERWIGTCMRALQNQTEKDFEIILVDNASTDRTVEKAKNFDIKIVHTKTPYRPGRAINDGVRVSSGKYIVCLSAHCVPREKTWLENLLKNFETKDVAGVYGRQEPMTQSAPADKRDLLNTFGLDRRVQVKDTFFHNANSAVRRDIWEKIPFDEKVTNIEDRVWGKSVISNGHKIVYEPNASVFHYHGIHQDGDVERCRNVVGILESLEMNRQSDDMILKDMNIVAIIPVKGSPDNFCNKPLIEYTIKRAVESTLIKKVIVSTDNEETAKISKKLGAEVPFIRDKSLSDEKIGIEDVLKYSLDELEERSIFPDLVVTLNVQFPFRPAGFLDDLIRLHFEKGFDSVFPGYPSYRTMWKETSQGIKRLDEGFQPQPLKDPVHVGYVGLGCVTFPNYIREGHLLGENVGIFEVLDSYSMFEIKDDDTARKMAEQLFPDWWKKNNQKNKRNLKETIQS